MATRIVVTYADDAAISNDGKRYELHEGDLSVTPAPGTRHQGVVGELSILLAVALPPFPGLALDPAAVWP